MRMILGAIMEYHATSSSICNARASWRGRRATAAGRVNRDVDPKLDIARYYAHDPTVDLPHENDEFLSCNNFFGQGSSTKK